MVGFGVGKVQELVRLDVDVQKEKDVFLAGGECYLCGSLHDALLMMLLLCDNRKTNDLNTMLLRDTGTEVFEVTASYCSTSSTTPSMNA